MTRSVTFMRTVATGGLAAVLTAAAAVDFAVVAAADPAVTPAADPSAPAPVAAVAPAAPPSGPVIPGIGVPPHPGALGLPPSVAGLDPTTVLGQHPVPSPPGAGPGTPPNLSIFNNAYGLPQYLVPSAPGEGIQFDVAPGRENADVGMREWFGRYIDMHRDGRLKGGLLGQMPESQLGRPLPGTAPLPGTNIPPGLAEYLPGPDGEAPPA